MDHKRLVPNRTGTPRSPNAAMRTRITFRGRARRARRTNGPSTQSGSGTASKTHFISAAALALAVLASGCSGLSSDPAAPIDAAGGAASPAALVTAIGLVENYQAAARDADQAAGKYLPVAYWVRLKAVSGALAGKNVILYVDAARTEYEPLLDRYLLRGRQLRYSGLPTRATRTQPAHIDTSVAGGRIEIVFDAVPAARVADCVVGRRVAFEGLVEPREPWMDKFAGQEGQNWKLIVTLGGGETVDIADPWLVESNDFQKTLALMRKRRGVKVRVVGEVRDAARYKWTDKRAGTPKDVRGNILIAVDELHILGDEPGEVKP